MALNDETIKLILDMGSSGKNVEDVRQKLDSLGQAVEGVDKKARASESGMKGWTQTIIGLGRATQDFVQGGVGGILNNIEQVFSRAPVVGAVLTGLAAVVYAAWSPVVSMFKAWWGGFNEIPGIRDKVKALTGELKETAKALDGMSEKGFLTDSELPKYLELLERQATLEKEIADQKERQTTFDKARKAAASEGLSSESAEVAQTIINDMMGGVDSARSTVGKALTAEARKGRLGEVERRLNSLADRQHQAATSGERWQLVDGSDGNKVFVATDIYVKALQEQIDKVHAEYKREFAKVADETDKLIDSALKGDQNAASRMTQLDPTRLREWLQATAGGQAFADEQEAASNAFADRARRGARARQEQRKEDALDEAAQKFRDQQDLDQAGRLEKMRIDRQGMDRQADAERAAFEANLDAPNVKAAIDAELQAQERALNGGFTGAESQQLASGNMALAEAGRGQSSEDKLQKIIGQNQAMMDSLSLSGGDGSAAMSAFMELQTQLLWTLGQLREVRMQQQQWRQMQQTSGTLLSRGRG